MRPAAPAGTAEPGDHCFLQVASLKRNGAQPMFQLIHVNIHVKTPGLSSCVIGTGGSTDEGDKATTYSQRTMVKCITRLLLVITMLVAPVTTVLANAVHLREGVVSPCHHTGHAQGGLHISAPAPDVPDIGDYLIHGVCTGCLLCSLCILHTPVHVICYTEFSALSGGGEGYQAEYSGSFTSLVSIPPLRPPIH